MPFIAKSICLISFTLILFAITAFGPEMMEIFDTRNLLLQNQSGFFDPLSKQPLRQKHQFYLYNITNSERFLRFDDTVVVNEIGPFSYYGVDSSNTVSDGSVRPLSLQDLQFSLSESVADESVFVYALNIQLFRRLSSTSSFLNSSRRNFVHKTTVRDVLREVVDGPSLGIRGADPFPETDDQGLFKELRDDVSKNYLQYLRNEICLRLIRVVRFLNPPTHTLTRLFQKYPCECVTVTPNGTEKQHPSIKNSYWSRFIGNWPDFGTSKYLFQWNDELCARSSNDSFFPIQQNWSVTKNLFWVSSPAYWRNKSSIQYRSVVQEARETWIKVEPMSDVVTDFFFEYQLNLPIKFFNGRSSLDLLNVYPILLTATSGVWGEHVESSIVRFILNAKETFFSFFEFLVFLLCFNLASTLYCLFQNFRRT